MKDFESWSEKKKKIDVYSKFQHPKVGEIWWCRIGVNIGTEIYGKGAEFTRPVLVINYEGSESVIGIPMTSKLKTKKHSCIIKTKSGVLCTALVYQVRNFDKRRFNKKLDKISEEDFKEILKIFKSLGEI